MTTFNVVSQIMQLTYCVIGLIGQTICLLIFTRPSMRSSYAFLLIGLSSFDFLTLIKGFLSGLKVLGAINYNFQSPGMFVFRWICDLGTKYFTVVIAAERYFVICHPMRSMKSNLINRGSKLMIWTLVFIAVATSFSYVFWKYIAVDGSKSVLIYQAVVLSFIPFTLVVLFTLGMCYGILKYNKSEMMKHRQNKKELSATKMLLAVTGFFGICIFFEVTRRILTFIGFYKPGTDYYDYTISHLSDHFYLLNSTLNIVIYGIMYKKFRHEFAKLFCNKKSEGPESGQSGTNQNQTANTISND